MSAETHLGLAHAGAADLLHASPQTHMPNWSGLEMCTICEGSIANISPKSHPEIEMQLTKHSHLALTSSKCNLETRWLISAFCYYRTPAADQRRAPFYW